MTVSSTDAPAEAHDGGADAEAVEPPIADSAPAQLTFVTADGNDDVETGACIDGVCAVDPPR